MAERKEREFHFTKQDFDFIARMVNEATGIMLPEHKQDMMYSRLTRRLRQLNLKSFKDYIALLDSPKGEKEIPNVVNAMTTNLTHFFREKHHFDHMKEHFQGLVAKPPPNKRIRVWSAGCSSGMEPYSIAMTLVDTIPNIGSWDVKILATDIDTNMLRTGIAGYYKPDDDKGIPESYRKKYTTTKMVEGKEMLSMNPELKRLIAFKRLNLLHPFPFKGPFDVAFCRNVVIYFDKETQKTLFDKIANVMKEEAWLYIGHSENLFNVTNRFKLIGKTIYQRVS